MHSLIPAQHTLLTLHLLTAYDNLADAKDIPLGLHFGSINDHSYSEDDVSVLLRIRAPQERFSSESFVMLLLFSSSIWSPQVLLQPDLSS